MKIEEGDVLVLPDAVAEHLEFWGDKEYEFEYRQRELGIIDSDGDFWTIRELEECFYINNVGHLKCGYIVKKKPINLENV